MDSDPSVPPYSTGDKTSFGYVTVRDRWPVILTGIIDDVHRAVSTCTEEQKIDEGKVIVENLAKLKYEVQHDRALTPIVDDGQSDVVGYNDELEALSSPTWFRVPWLYAECYIYRRLNTLFSLTKHWKSYDVFARQKLSTFKSSRPAVIELASRYKELVVQLKKQSSTPSSPNVAQTERLLFIEMCEICLWGNATDLSLLTSLTYEDLQKLQGSEARRSAEKNIIANDLPAAFEALRKAQLEDENKERRVDIVLDNAGFELFVDLFLAGYLLSSNLATHVVLHPKSIPWFVSDVIPADFAALLNVLADPQPFYSTPSEDDKHAGKVLQPLSTEEVDQLSFLYQSWSNFHAEGQLVIRPNRFWTKAGGFWRLPTTDSALWEDLKTSELVIFKGDLNYRKLTADVAWDPSTPFTSAIGPLGPGSGIRTLALRTCKADVVVGLAQGEDERLKAMEGGGGDSGARKWAWSGKWAVAQFCDGKIRGSHKTARTKLMEKIMIDS